MQYPQSTMFLPQPNHQCNINPCPITTLLQNPSPTMLTTFTPVETPWTSTCKTAWRIAKEQAQAAEPHLTFFFMETPMPTCKSPLCCEAHHQYPNKYLFPWMSKSQYLYHLERSNYGFRMTLVPHQQLEVTPSQPDTLGPLPLHHLIVLPPQFIGGSHQEEDTRFLFHPQLRMTLHQYNQ
jgi:hypothetical protein